MSTATSTVIVVEDEAKIRRFIKLALEAEQLEVFEADSVARGLIEVGTRQPDLVVLDLGLPDGDGIDLIRDLRTWSDIPIIVLSARTAEADKVAALDAAPFKDAVIAIDKVWGEAETWATIKRSSSVYTPFYILSMLDLRQDANGSIERVPADRSIYKDILARTLGISFLVTLMTLIFGYPVAYLLATSPQKTASILMIFVLLPFWTSLLVRTTAWMILMTDGGVFAQVLNYTGITWLLNTAGLMEGEPQLFKTRFATIVAMTHIQLPFTLLPIYSVMKTISPNYMRAAKSLGGTPFYCFLRVYMPQTLPGVAAGCLLTFILCLGYYITPALVGGPTDQMISGFIERAINSEHHCGKASALGVILLTATMILYYVYNKLIGIDRMKLG